MADRYLDRVGPGEQKRLIAEATDLRDQLRYFSLGCPLAQRMLNTEEGAAKLLHLLLLAEDQKATEDDALALTLHLAGEEMKKVLAKAQGGSKAGDSGPNEAGGADGPA